MKILSLGLDNSVLNKTSALARRAVEYGNLVERYDVIVPSAKNEKIELSGKTLVYGSGGGNKLGRLVKICWLAKKLLRGEKYDIITVQDQYYLALIGLRLARKFKIGLEIQVHGFEKFYGLRKLIAKYVLSRARAVRCVSQRLKKQLIGQFGVKEEKITVAPIYVDTVLPLPAPRSKLAFVEFDQRLPHRPDYGASRNDTNAFIFLTVGRLAPVKNIGLQIAAAREVIKRHPETELWIVGDGPERKNYELLIADYELNNNIKLPGRQENLENYYKAADAFILTSDSEGWGLAVIEAARSGLPIIMTDVGCAGEVIKNGESGLVVPIGGKEELAEAMLKIIEDENLRKKFGINAKLAAGRLPDKRQTLERYKKSWKIAAINV